MLIEEKGKRHHVLIKDFSTFMYGHTLQRERKYYRLYCLQAFSAEERLKCRIKDCFKINVKQRIIMPKKGVYVKFKNYPRKIKPPFLLKESYTNKYKNHIVWSYGYKLACVDDRFSRPFKTYLGKDVVYNFINSIKEESKYCKEVIKKHFNKKLLITKEDNEYFENSTKCWICNNHYVDNDVKVRDHCHITGKYRGSAHRDCNINLNLNKKVPVVFYNLKNCDSNLIMQEPDKFNLKINVILNEFKKYVSFTINNKLSLIENFQFLSSSFDTLVKN